MLGAGTLRRPRGMVQGGRRDEGSGWGTHVYLWQIHVDVWQNQYNCKVINLQLKWINLYLKKEKKEEPEIKLPTCVESSKKWETSRKTSTSALLTYAKAFECVDDNKLWKILKEMGIPDHLTCLLRNLVKKQQLELDTELQTGSKSGKEYVKAVYCHSAY